MESTLMQVAQAAGMKRASKKWTPCPSCGDGPVLLGRGEKWRCMRCQEGGDAIALAGWHLGLTGSPSGADYHKASRFVNESAGVVVEQEPQPVVDLPVASVLAGCIPLNQVVDQRLDPFLASKGLNRSAPAGYLRNPPEWFPRGYPLVIPCFSGKGELKSMHGRAIDPDRPPGKRKTWPRGVEARELLFLDPRWTRPWVRRHGPPPGRVLLCEGITDYLNGALRMPTIGLANGSIAALRLVPFTRDTLVVSAMDPDQAGDGYSEKIADAIWPAVHRAIPLRRLNCLT